MRRALNAPAEVREASLKTAIENSRQKSVEKYIEAYDLAIETKKGKGRR